MIALLVTKNDVRLLLVLLCLFLFPVFFIHKKRELHIAADEIAYLRPSWNGLNLSCSQTFYNISRELDCLAEKYPQAQFIVMPESSFPYNILDWQEYLPAWSSLFGQKASIVIGTHRCVDGRTYNSLCQIVDGVIVTSYDKQHLMPFVERIPYCERFTDLGIHLFMGSNDFFTYPVENQSAVEFAGCAPFICSELFCEDKKPIAGKPILFICNDDWFGLLYAQNLAKRYAQLYALRYAVPIIYVGSENFQIIL